MTDVEREREVEKANEDASEDGSEGEFVRVHSRGIPSEGKERWERCKLRQSGFGRKEERRPSERCGSRLPWGLRAGTAILASARCDAEPGMCIHDRGTQEPAAFSVHAQSDRRPMPDHNNQCGNGGLSRDRGHQAQGVAPSDLLELRH